MDNEVKDAQRSIARADDGFAPHSVNVFGTLTRLAPVGIFQTDANGNCLFVNERWCEMAGLSPEQAQGPGWAQALHPDDRDRVAREWYAAAKNNTEFTSEYRFQTPQGCTTWLKGSAAALHDDAGHLLGYIGTVTDISARMHAEDALRSSEAQLRLVTDHAPVFIAHCDAQRRFKFVNYGYAARFGLAPDEFVGKTIAEVLGEEAYASFSHHIDRVLQGEKVEFETVIPYDRIGPRTIHCSYVPEREATGQVVGWVAVLTDVTDQRQANHALLDSQARFARFTQHLPGLAWIKDLDGRYVYVNNAAETAFRKPRLQLYGKTDWDLFPTATAAMFRENDARALASESGIQIIETLEDPDGVLRHSLVSKFPIPGADDKPALVGGMAIDITERLRAEEQLRSHKERLELSQNVGRIGTFDWNIQTGDVEWSTTEEEIFGLPPGGFGGRFESWSNAVHPEDRDQAIAACQYAVDTRTDLEIEFRIVRPDGQMRWLVAHGKVLCDEAGQPVRMIGVNTDVTEHKEAARHKDEFLATLAHELRNPLAPISNALQLLRLASDNKAILEQARVMMERQLQHMVRLVDDLLDVSRITRNKLDLRKEWIELSTIVHNAVECSRPLIDSLGHHISVSLPPTPILLDADPVRLAQVLSNLLNNSAKYTENAGQIWLTAEVDNGWAVIKVRDTGIGISVEKLKHIFEMFVQLNDTSRQAQGGLGIGLTLVKRLVEMHGGSVEAHSEGPGQGTEFTVRLPLVVVHTTPDPASGKAHASIAPAARSRKVLVADDNADSATSLAMMLRAMGHTVETARDGHEAVELARLFQPEIALLDIGMPKMTGYVAASHIRQEPWADGIILVAVTGWGQDDDRRKTQAAGFDYHLVKPADPRAIAKILEINVP